MSNNKQFIPPFGDMKDIRNFLELSLERDIIGPSWKSGTTEKNLEEILDLGEKGEPNRYYLTGYLSPMKEVTGNSIRSMSSLDDIPPDDEVQLTEETKNMQLESKIDELMDAASGEMTFLSLSTMGLTFLPSSKIIEVEVDWGRYSRNEDLWNRRECNYINQISLDSLEYGEEKEISIDEDGNILYLKKGYESYPTLTIRIVNKLVKQKKQRSSEVTIFQPTIKIKQKNSLLDVRKKEEIFKDETMTILYHHSIIPAKGHNIGVNWSVESNEIWTTFLPRYEVPKMEKNSKLSDHIPEMNFLIDEDKINTGLNQLLNLVNTYDSWISEAENRLLSPSISENLQVPEIRERIVQHISQARVNSSRMREGIFFLQGNDMARDAFRLANASIKYSQDRPTISEVRNRLDENGNFIPFKWYPFQISFQLLNIRGLCALDENDVGRDERDIIDLAWFPTGGGKTEAYLGLISIIGFYRRLRYPEKELSPSVHVIMRYTLRLLTSDQADRLVRLVVGMNHVANTMGAKLSVKEYQGQEFPPFRVGMWVGKKVSPNFLLSSSSNKYSENDNAEDALIKLKSGDEETGDGSVIQFETCPWCGNDHEFGIKNAENWEVVKEEHDNQWGRLLNSRPTLHGRCNISDPECEICQSSKRDIIDDEINSGIIDDEVDSKNNLLSGASLIHRENHMTNCEMDKWVPFTCVDDDLYLNPPSILLATADKFVQLSNNPFPKHINEEDPQTKYFDARSMLGFDSERGTSRAPDLIIQDELHLLTGPLGTLAGLIETTLDVSWRSFDHKVKYVAATATIRGAERDAKLMYGRDLNVFPPPVEDANDNFFAKANYTSGKGRMHLGILSPPGKDQTLFAQPTASLLQRVYEIRHNNPDKLEMIDPYWTLVAYFNSLRELGSAQSSLSSRIPEFTERFSQTGISTQRQLNNTPELTSRRTASELKDQKAALNKEIGELGSVDTVVTTNMFQVGIDIPRLGLMTINGQPKSNSEYIQSSGRVGRKHPGLVISLLRSKYPRDQSHFENFRLFHQEMYKHVDITSTTPFSVRALDRALSTALTILIRMGIPEVSGRKELHQLSYFESRADKLYLAFRKQLKDRQKVTDNPQPIVDESISSLERTWGELMDFSEDPNVLIGTDKNLKAWWKTWNESEIKKYDVRGWLKSNIINNPDISGQWSGISSLRDVAEEIRADEYWKINDPDKIQEKNIRSLPESHFFQQAVPGGLWDKDGQTFLTMGINKWVNGPRNDQNLALKPSGDGGLEINEETLVTLLEDQNISLRELPRKTSKHHGIVSYQRFPYKYGFRCSSGHLSSISSPDEDGFWRCTREGCIDEEEQGRPRKAYPTRWVSACQDGHLHHFDYWLWAHKNSNDRITCSYSSDINLIKTPDASYHLSGWIVECQECKQSHNMGDVNHVRNNEESYNKGQRCRSGKKGGDRPWLGIEANEECQKRLTHHQTGSVALTYTDRSSVMLLPLGVSWSYANNQAVRTLRSLPVDEMKEASKHKFLAPQMNELKHKLRGTSYLENGDFTRKFFETVHEFESLHNSNEPLLVENLRYREHKALKYSIEGDLEDKRRFDCRPILGNEIELPIEWREESWPIQFVSRLDRMTELAYITGIKRISTSEYEEDEEIPPQLLLDDNGQKIPRKEQPLYFKQDSRRKYGIAKYNHGEGIYLEIKNKWIQDIVDRRNTHLSERHASMTLSSLKFLPNILKQIPSINKKNGSNALTVLHTFSHLIIKELCMISGYSLGSIRERLYLDLDDDGLVKTAGILLYTSGPSSDGTLGGLVSQSSRKSIEEAVKRALHSKDNCSNDPICMGHIPVGEERNGAACHTCVLLPETCCELRNFSLDRNWCD